MNEQNCFVYEPNGCLYALDSFINAAKRRIDEA
jgi:hypothetical protein